MNSKKINNKKLLSLNKETIDVLTSRALKNLRGGGVKVETHVPSEAYCSVFDCPGVCSDGTGNPPPAHSDACPPPIDNTNQTGDCGGCW